MPYRVDFEGLVEFVEAGAGHGDIPLLGPDARPFKLRHRIWRTGVALGLLNRDTLRATTLGRRFAAGGEAERRDALARGIASCSPYARVIVAALERRHVVTPLEWIRRWWADHRLGTSPTNREEGAVVFARLVDAAGLGVYVIGRSGYPSRIEWTDEAVTRFGPWDAAVRAVVRSVSGGAESR